MEYHHSVYKCHKCGADIDKWYDIGRYRYKLPGNRLFCSWTCYRRYLSERKGQNKSYYLFKKNGEL